MPESLPSNDNRLRLIKYAAFCLNRKPYFTESLRQKLVLRSKKLNLGDTSETINGILADLGRSGYLDDSYLAGAYVRRQLSKGHGPRMIRMKLSFLKLDSAIIETALETDCSESQQVEAIRKYLRRYSRLDQRKIISRLYSRGFSSCSINKVFDAEHIEE